MLKCQENFFFLFICVVVVIIIMNFGFFEYGNKVKKFFVQFLVMWLMKIQVLKGQVVLNRYQEMYIKQGLVWEINGIEIIFFIIVIILKIGI